MNKILQLVAFLRLIYKLGRNEHFTNDSMDQFPKCKIDNSSKLHKENSPRYYMLLRDL